MKRNKWFKWKIGAAASLGIALLFHEVRASDAFKQAVADMSAAGGGKIAAAARQSDDPIMDDATWQSFFNEDDTGSSSNSGSAANNNSVAGSQSAPSNVSPNNVHSRTGRS